MSIGYVEKNLWDYNSNVAELSELEYQHDDLMSVQGHSYEVHGENTLSDPVSEVVHRRLKLERRMQKLKSRIRPVRKLYDDLSIGTDARITQMRGVLKMRYMEHKSHEDVMRNMAVSKATYWRRVSELLRLTRRYFGEDRERLSV